jgi:hypothetical protein
MPHWLRRLLRRADEPEDTPERVHERRQPRDDGVSVLENADRAAVGPLTQLYVEGRTKRPR